MSFLYTRRGFVIWVLFCSILIGAFTTVLRARNNNLAVVDAWLTFFFGFLIGLSISMPIWFYNTKSTSDIWVQDTPKPKPNPAKKLVLHPDQTFLEAEHHRLTEFNLEEIHNLHELVRINLGLNQLKTIDLSSLAGSTSLVELILYMNLLETIDLSPLASCPNLEYLDLTDNDLENIDLTPLSSCPKLNALNIGINQTTKLDLSPLRVCRNLKILTIDGMNLKEIDLSPLSDCIKLEFLKVEDEELKSLDITPLFGCRSLTDFSIGRVELTTTLNREIEDWPKGVRKHRRKIQKFRSST